MPRILAKVVQQREYHTSRFFEPFGGLGDPQRCGSEQFSATWPCLSQQSLPRRLTARADHECRGYWLKSCSKENTTLRASLNPLAVSVIPNAVVASNFRPLQAHEARSSQLQSEKGALLPPPADPSQAIGPGDPLTIVVISRLFYNKGTDLLISAIPLLLRRHDNLRFIIAGSGPKAIDLEQTLDSLPPQLLYTSSGQSRVVLLGSIRHEEVRNVMVRGHLLLSTSLTEAFGTVLVEAASCGLMVVATRVGGVPEVLPSNMTVFVLPEVEDVVRGVTEAVGLLTSKAVRRDRFHDLVKNMYSWSDIARRTERVYDLITGSPSASDNEGYYDEEWQHYGQPAQTQSFALIDRLKRYFGCGIWAGKLFVIVVVVDYLIYCFLEVMYPRDSIDLCKPWPVRKMSAADQSHGEAEKLMTRISSPSSGRMDESA
nr:phosphatidylinositol n-acetylglucosaminyltransferase gpi3 subunit [Quercus suber]